MATCLKPFGCGVVASVFWAACALAQTAQPETAKQMAFPLAEVTTPLDRATIEATVAKARAVDVNVTVPAVSLNVIAASGAA